MIGGGSQKITVEIGGKIAASLGAALRGAQTQVSSFGRNVSRTMNDAATASKKSFKNVFNNDLWQGATVGATAFVGAIGLSVREAMKFDSAMADIRKAVDFADGEKGVKRFGSQLIKLSTELPYTAEQLTKIAAAAGFAGYAEKDIIPFTKSAAAMGVAFQMTAEDAGEAMVAMRASMGLTQPEVEQLGDAINYLSDKFQGTVNAADLVEVSKRIGAIGKASGLAKEEIAGLGAAFLASGTPVEVAGTGLKNFLNALTKGENVTKRQSEALTTLFGSDVSTQLAKDMQSDAEGTIKKVIGAMSKLSADKRVSVAGALFGEESKAAIMPLLTNTKLLTQAFDLIADKTAFAGSMQKEFKNQMGTSAAQTKIFQNGIQAVGISVGAALLPSLNSILKTITPLLVKFGEWAQKNEGLVTTIVLIGGALAGLVIALPIIAGVISAIVTIGKAIAGAKLLLAAWAIGFKIIGGTIFAAMLPLLPWIALIAGIGVGIYLLVKNWDKVKAAAGRAWEGIKAGWGQFTNWIGKLFNDGLAIVQAWAPKVLSFLFPIPALIINNWKGIVTGVRDIFTKVVNFIKETPARVASVGGAVITAIINGLKSKAGELMGWISGTWDGIKNFFTGEDAAPTAAPAGGGMGGGRSARPPGRALGGAVRAGMPYIVGERRRELFVPGMSGAIVPKVARPVTAAALAGLLAAPLPAAAAGGGAVTIHAPVTINAAGGDAMEIRRQVELAFTDIQYELASAHRVLLND
jgi:TP901 family phage tail tape measure protein